MKLAATVIEHLRDENCSVLLVSHSISDIERVCDRVAVLSAGRIAREGELESLAREERGGINLEAALRREPPAMELAI